MFILWRHLKKGSIITATQKCMTKPILMIPNFSFSLQEWFLSLLFINKKGALIGDGRREWQQSKQGMQKLLLVQVALLIDNGKASKLQGAHLIYQVHQTGFSSVPLTDSSHPETNRRWWIQETSCTTAQNLPQRRKKGVLNWLSPCSFAEAISTSPLCLLIMNHSILVPQFYTGFPGQYWYHALAMTTL